MRATYIQILLIMLALTVVISQIRSAYRVEVVEGRKCWRMKWIAVILISVVLVYYTWNRSLGFGDTGTYANSYKNLNITLSGLRDYLIADPKDFGYTTLMVLFKSIGLDFRTVLLIIAVLQITLLNITYRKYSSNYLLSILLFVLSTDFYSWMWNGMRQFTAASIMFAGAGFIFDDKKVKAIFVILLASTFHQSALIMLPVLFFVQGRAFNKWSVICILFTVGIMFAVDLFTDVLDSALENTQYSTVVTDYQTGVVGVDDGTNPLRVLVYSVPLILALAGKKTIAWEDNNVINVCCNMSVVTTSLYLISMVSSGIYMGRLPIYFSLYNYILLPWEIKKLFTPSSSKLMMVLCIMGYSCFYYYQMFVSWA